MGVGRGGRGALAPLVFELLAKKVVFSLSRGRNQSSPRLAPPERILGKYPTGLPLEKSFRRPCSPSFTKKHRFVVRSRLKWGSLLVMDLGVVGAALRQPRYRII